MTHPAMKPSKDAKSNSRTADKFVVRLPDGLRDLIGKAAKHQNRSMNSELVRRMWESLARDYPDDVRDLGVDIKPLEATKKQPKGWVPAIGMLVYYPATRISKRKAGVIRDILVKDDRITLKVDLGEPFGVQAFDSADVHPYLV